MKRKKKFRPGDRIIVVENDAFAMFDIGQKGEVTSVVDNGKTYRYRLSFEKEGKLYFFEVTGEGIELCPKEGKDGEKI